MSPSPRRQPLAHDVKLALLALAGGFPAVALLVGLLHFGDYSAKVRWTFDAVAIGVWIGVALAIRERVARPLQTLSNLTAGLREGDYSLRGRRGHLDDPLTQAYHELNLLADRLRTQRLGALEASALLGQVMEEIDVSIFAVDESGRLRFLNRAAESLLGQPAPELVGRTLEELGLGELLEGEPARTLPGPVARRPGPYELRRRDFRQEGLPHRLVVLTDLRRALREEERQAWQRLVRVLGHEINNSLAPIQSIAASLAELASTPNPPPDFREDLAGGLAVIARRSEGLARFMTSYARLARLPPPRLSPLSIGPFLERVVALEKRLTVMLDPGPEAFVFADEDQLEQVLINLIKNAVDAVLEVRGARGASTPVGANGETDALRQAQRERGSPGVRVGWRVAREVELFVEDDGPGLPETANLFVPFFTTKPGGSGIGLVLSRQIVEAHGGHLALENRAGTRGCVARLRLPRAH